MVPLLFKGGIIQTQLLYREGPDVMEEKVYLPKNKKLKEFANAMRKQPTDEEKKLWYDFLKYITPKFHRQKVIGNYIADFYCPKLKVIIEVDGCQHYEEENVEYDKKRTLFFNSFGYEVIRVDNYDASHNIDNVAAYILEICRKKSKELNVEFKYSKE